MAVEDDKQLLITELARRRPLDPFRALGVSPNATEGEVRAAFLAATKRFHPTRFARRDAETRDAATELFLVIRRAYVELDDPERRRVWLAKIAPTKPIPAVHPPLATARTPQPPPAAAAKPAPPVRTAPPLPPQRPLVRVKKGEQIQAAPPQPKREVEAMLESAKTRTARFDEATRFLAHGEWKKAREAFHRLAGEDPHSKRVRAHLHLAWGLEHKAEGRVIEAQREFERGIGIDPEHHELTEELRKLDSAKGKEMGKGIFAKLLGR
jgi:tetratricopeptide (TPR) repeat protein